MLPSLVIFVSGLPHSLQMTKSSAYCPIFSLILEAGTLDLKIAACLYISPGVASSLRMYLRKCCGFLPRICAMAMKLDTIVLFPSIWPLTFGISKRSPVEASSGRISFARSKSSSYDVIYLAKSRGYFKYCAFCVVLSYEKTI